MQLYIFPEGFVARLRRSVKDNIRLYERDEPWIGSLADGANVHISTGMKPKARLELLPPDSRDFKDLENAIRLHKALRFLTPVQARDPRLWTRLAHVEFWPYMRKRWSVERFNGDIGKAERFVLWRFFVAQNQSRALVRHGIARLWWYANLTHDPDRANPYELTGVLLSQLDITQQILERNLGRSPHMLTGFLEFLLRHHDELLGAGGQKRTLIRHLAKHLNLVGGSTLLDCLKRSEVTALLEDELRRVRRKPERLDVV